MQNSAKIDQSVTSDQCSSTVSTNIVLPSVRSAECPERTNLYFPALDGLRFFAFLLVFIHHLPKSPSSEILGVIHDQGWVGVHLFLFISAYLLTAILAAERSSNGRISVRNFYIRRGLRIWPLYFLYVVAVFLLSVVLAHQLSPHWLRLASLLAFVDNIVSGVSGYNPIPFTAHLWTIALEEQFYLVLPFFLGAMLLSRKRLVIGLFVCWFIFLGVRISLVLFGAPHPGIWTSVFSADSLLLGTLFGALRPPAPRSKLSRMILPVIGVLLIFSGAFMPGIEKLGFHQVYLYTAVAIGAAIVTFSALHEPFLQFLTSRSLRYLGKVSYGLYVFHMLGIAIGVKAGKHLLPDSWWIGACLALLITIAIAAFSYRFFEKYFLTFKHRFEAIRSRPI